MSEGKKDVWPYRLGNMAGPCFFCGKSLGYYETKLINAREKLVCCTKHMESTNPGPNRRFGVGWVLYSDG